MLRVSEKALLPLIFVPLALVIEGVFSAMATFAMPFFVFRFERAQQLPQQQPMIAHPRVSARTTATMPIGSSSAGTVWMLRPPSSGLLEVELARDFAAPVCKGVLGGRLLVAPICKGILGGKLLVESKSDGEGGTAVFGTLPKL